MNESRKNAVALRYEKSQKNIPEIAASGKGFIAENIIEKAIKNDIPILEDPTLIGLLAELNINETIPEELYQAVAEVFAFIYHADQHKS